MVRRRNLQSKSTLFVVLMLGAALAAVLPARWTSWVRRPFQVIHRISRPAADGAAAAARALGHVAPHEYSKEQVEAMVREVEELRLLVAQQDDMLEGQKWLLQQLSDFRQKFPESVGEIVIGRVEAFGTDPEREMLVISPGSLGGIREGDWVAAGLELNRLSEDLDGRTALFRRWLIGRVETTQPKFSHVQRITDPGFQTVVVPAGVEGRVWRIRGGEMVLKGAGNGKMVVESATADYFNEGAQILLTAGDGQLPARMAVGRIVASEQLVNSPLHYRLEVEPWQPHDATTTVFVVVPRDNDQ